MKFKVQVEKPRELRVKLYSIRWNIFSILLNGPKGVSDRNSEGDVIGVRTLVIFVLGKRLISSKQKIRQVLRKIRKNHPAKSHSTLKTICWFA